MAGLNDIMQCLHRLTDWRMRVKPMALQNVDVANLQPFEGTLYTIEDMLKISVSEFRAYEDRHEGVYLAIETLLVDYV